jgi:hypothetical protein
MDKDKDINKKRKEPHGDDQMNVPSKDVKRCCHAAMEKDVVVVSRQDLTLILRTYGTEVGPWRDMTTSSSSNNNMFKNQECPLCKEAVNVGGGWVVRLCAHHCVCLGCMLLSIGRNQLTQLSKQCPMCRIGDKTHYWTIRELKDATVMTEELHPEVVELLVRLAPLGMWSVLDCAV